MRYLLILSVFLFGCSKEEAIIRKPYQLRTAVLTAGYGQGTLLWIKEINLSNEIILDINADYSYESTSNNKIYNIDIEKLSDTTNVRVILTFDCDTATIIHELYGLVRDGIPEFYDIKEEAMINFYKDKRTVILVEASPVCNPEITVYYE